MKGFIVVLSLVFTSLVLLTYSSCRLELPPALASVATVSPFYITHTTATTGGLMIVPRQSPVLACGVCWGTSPMPDLGGLFTTDKHGAEAFTSTLIDLTANTTYYIRSYVTNNAGTVYGEEMSFTTLGPDAPFPVYDVDGNGYNTVTIGNQTWLQENLRTTRYRDGTPIISIRDTDDYFKHPEGGMGWLGNDSAKNAADYGAFYSWLTAMRPERLCPAGWRVPEEKEFYTLANALGGIFLGGGPLKSTTPDWVSPNIGATNSSGFTARPAGEGFSDGTSFRFGTQANFWTTMTLGTSISRSYALANSHTNVVDIDISRFSGISVRCIKE